ncbi:ataxin-2 homolog isoform X1 [Anopheles darlingi]|uniref:ataxin-2 homolog isoform X1 n=2 Tax=Anopheles darlingi TaxID=43151 RepID=UPI0020FFF9CD|nr:ataxin-2 homolog isoform X1 [Anopheles darlingi]XP_049534289.1 ataxin-2 homolog isoform X1 [Anopheles darlingi]
MSKRNKTRPGPARTQRQRSIQAEGIYNNPPFMHAATSHVGNIVQIHTTAGHIYEGVFRTFSSQFQVVLEMAHRIEVGADQKTKIIVETHCDRLIFKANDIVTIAAKDVDPEYATRDTFKTDTAISRCNGTSWLEDRELEPWDPSGGTGLNGDHGDHSLELDSNADGWDVNDMFRKNETIYGLHSTFDQSLSGYTVPIQKRDSEEFKVQELEAEKIANEIENNPVYKERIDIENGDEEAAFAAVVRPPNASPAGGGSAATQPAAATNAGGGLNDKNSNNISSNSSSSSTTSSSHSINANSNTNSNNINNNNANSSTTSTMSVDKYVVPNKRKPGQQGGKLVKNTPPPLANNNNNGSPVVVPSQQQQQQQQPPSPHAPPPHKNSYGQMMSQPQHQQPPPQQQHQQPPPQQQQPSLVAGNQQQHGAGAGGMQQQQHPQYGLHANQSPYMHVQHQQQPPTPQQQQQQQQQQAHGQPPVMNKMNGDGGGQINVNSNQKPLPQRNVRQYQNAPAPVTYSEPPPSLNPQQMSGPMQNMSTKPPMHMTHPHHTVVTHMPPPAVVADGVVMQQHHVAMPPPPMMAPANQQQQQQTQPPPQPQRTGVVRNRDMEIDNLRKFGQDFKLAPPQQPQPTMPNVHQQPPPPTPVAQQQGPPPSQQQQQQQQQLPPPTVTSQSQQEHHPGSSPDNVKLQPVVVPPQHNEPPPATTPTQQQQQQQNQASQTTGPSGGSGGMLPAPHLLSQQPPPSGAPQQQVTQPSAQPPQTVTQQQQPGSGSPPQTQPQPNHVQGTPGVVVIVGNGSPANVLSPPASTPSAVSAGSESAAGATNSSSSSNGATDPSKPAGTATKKVFTLNPAAKPFTPRSPSTPNPSRHTSSSPHTPQTPGPAALAQGSYQPPQPPTHQVIPQPFVMQYVVNSSSFQTAQQHPHATQPTRIRNGRQGSYRNEIFPVGASQIQVAAATGQPLLAPSPLQMLTPYGPTIHPSSFQAGPPFHQPYRIYDTPQPAQLQYLAATPPSSTPSPGQPHQQYHPGPQPSPAGGGPPAYAQVHHQQPTPYPVPICPIPQVVPTIYQNMTSAPQQNHHQQNLHVMHVAQHPTAQ